MLHQSAGKVPARYEKAVHDADFGDRRSHWNRFRRGRWGD